MKKERLLMNPSAPKMFFALLLLATQVFVSSVFSTPMNSPQDPQPLYTVLGIDRFYKQRNKGEIKISISPFYQNANSSKNGEGKKVVVGNRQGAWNLYGILWGLDARPNNTTPISPTNYQNLYAAQQVVKGITTKALTDSRYRVGPAGSTLTPPQLFPVADGLANELNFDTAKHTFAYLDVPLVYEKLGLRGQVNFDFGFGLGVSVKGGMVDLKHIYKPMTFEKQFDLDRGATSDSAYTPSADTKADSQALYNGFMAPNVRTQIFKELGYDTGKGVDFPSFHKTGAEDMHLGIYWHFPKKFKDDTGDVAVVMAPYLAVGAWIPTGEKTGPSGNILALPTGNDGYYGITADVSLAFDFPLVTQNNKQTLQIAVGGGALFFNKKDQKNIRFPSSALQVGLYPWVATQIKKRPGTTWYFNVSLKSEEFLDGFSFFMDYIYTQHLKDRIDIIESDAKRLAAFMTGFEAYRINSMWKVQQLNIGINYKWSPTVSCGFAVQPCLGGIRIYRTITILGGLSVTF